MSVRIAEPLRPLVVPIGDVRPDPQNVRRHPERNLEAIRASLRRYGQRKPIVVNRADMVIEAGAGTWQAMNAEGAAEIAVVFVEDDPTTATGFAVADNRTAELAEWDEAALLADLEALAQAGELGMVGFDARELAVLGEEVKAASEPRERFDLARALAELGEPRVHPGEVWQLGRHRLACGDARDPAAWAAVMDGRKADLIVSSPPYNTPSVKYAAGLTDQVGPRDEYLALIRAAAVQIQAHLARGRFVAWNLGVTPHVWAHRQVVLFEELGFRYHRQVVWRKVGVPWPAIYASTKRREARRYTPNWVHEMVYLFQADGGVEEMAEVECPVCAGSGRARGYHPANEHEVLVLLLNGEAVEPGGPIAINRRWASDVWVVAQNPATKDIPSLGVRGFEGGRRRTKRHMIKAHPAPFPVEIPKAAITLLTAAGEAVVDPFVGVGTTIMAAEQTGRTGYGIDLLPLYCELTLQRFEANVGMPPERVGTFEPAR